MQAQWVRLIGKLTRSVVVAASIGFAGAAISQVSVPGGKGNIAIIFGLTSIGPQEGGPIQVNLIGDKNEPERSLVIIGPNCEVAMAHGGITIGPIDKQLELSRKVGPRRGMAAVATYAQRIGFKLSPQEIECGGRVMGAGRTTGCFEAQLGRVIGSFRINLQFPKRIPMGTP